jgi:serine/threonine-protein kinase
MRIGTQLAGYRLEQIIGRGGMGIVYLAEQVHLGRKVALKVLPPKLAGDRVFRERFMRESRIAASLDHPNVIPIYDAGEGGGHLYIAMRHVEGPDLGRVLEREGHLSAGATLFILEQVAGALDAAHRRNLIHRDVKPANVLVDEEAERVYLTDFGVAKDRAGVGLTKTGFFVGTVAYAAPEQIEGGSLDGRADVYALGCLFYECLTGSPPFERDEEVAVMHAHLLDPPPLVTSRRPSLPQQLDHVVARAMAKSPEDRYATCSELVTAAHDAAVERRPASGLERPAPEAVPSTRAADRAAAATPPRSEQREHRSSVPPPTRAEGPSRGTRKRWLLPGIAVLIALAGAGTTAAFLLTGGEDSGKAGAGGTSTTETTSTGPEAMGHEEQLAALVPRQIWTTCKTDHTPRLGAEASAACDFHPPAEERRQRRELIDLYLFGGEGATTAAYSSQRVRLRVAKNAQPCSGHNSRGQGVWYHDAAQTEPGGRYFCSTTRSRQPIIGWNSVQSDLLALVRCDCDHPDLFSWWRFWVHRFRVTGHGG